MSIANLPAKSAKPAPIEPANYDDVMRLAHVAVRAGHFGLKNVEDATFRILYGRELGLSAMASLMGIDMIQGRPGPKANTIAAIIDSSDRFAYRVKAWTETECQLVFFDRGEQVGESRFTIEDARRAKLVKPDSNWEKYPRAMLFARALTQGARAYCPSVFMGPVYSSEELSDGYDTIDGASIPTVTPTADPPKNDPPSADEEAKEETPADKVRKLDDWAGRVAARFKEKGVNRFGSAGEVVTEVYERFAAMGLASGDADNYRRRTEEIAAIEAPWKEILTHLKAFAESMARQPEPPFDLNEPGANG